MKLAIDSQNISCTTLMILSSRRAVGAMVLKFELHYTMIQTFCNPPLDQLHVPKPRQMTRAEIKELNKR